MSAAAYILPAGAALFALASVGVAKLSRRNLNRHIAEQERELASDVEAPRTAAQQREPIVIDLMDALREAIDKASKSAARELDKVGH